MFCKMFFWHCHKQTEIACDCQFFLGFWETANKNSKGGLLTGENYQTGMVNQELNRAELFI